MIFGRKNADENHNALLHYMSGDTKKKKHAGIWYGRGVALESGFREEEEEEEEEGYKCRFLSFFLSFYFLQQCSTHPTYPINTSQQRQHNPIVITHHHHKMTIKNVAVVGVSPLSPLSPPLQY